MSDEKRERSKALRGCPAEADLVASVRGELTPDAASSAEQHLAACDACRKRVSEIRDLLGILQTLPAEPAGRDLAPDILRRLPEPAAGQAARTALSQFPWKFRAVALAAALLMAAWAGWMLVDTLTTPRAGVRPQASTEVKLALNWLACAQEADGSWNPNRWGGQGNYTVGLTGLALLAFAGADETPAEGRCGEVVARAVNYLLRRQSASGRFGPFFSGAPYNHGIATVALLETYGRTRDPALRMPLARAVHFITTRQDKRGGWGYLGPQVSTNTSITAWQLHALLLADSLGWSDSNATAKKGLSWLAGIVDSDGLAGYRRTGDFPHGPGTLTAMTAFCLSVGERRTPHGDKPEMVNALLRLASESTGKVDYYKWYFLSRALRVTGERAAAPDPRLGRLAAGLRTALTRRQLKSGPNSGSWEPSDQWSAAGGRVYATAMATLSLQADTRAHDLLGHTRTAHP